MPMADTSDTERETDLLFAYVAKNPSTVEQYYSHLAKSHREELIPIFQQRIAGKAARASNRRDYQDVCRIIRMLREVGEREAVEQTVKQLLAHYSNKPAFRDELGRI